MKIILIAISAMINVALWFQNKNYRSTISNLNEIVNNKNKTIDDIVSKLDIASKENEELTKNIDILNGEDLCIFIDNQNETYKYDVSAYKDNIKSITVNTLSGGNILMTSKMIIANKTNEVQRYFEYHIDDDKKYVTIINKSDLTDVFGYNTVMNIPGAISLVINVTLINDKVISNTIPVYFFENPGVFAPHTIDANKLTNDIIRSGVDNGMENN